MEQTLPITHVKKSQWGTPKVGGVTVAFLSTFLNDPEWPVARICAEYELSPAEVHAGWSYYYDHQDDIDRAIEEGKALTHEVGSPVDLTE